MYLILTCGEYKFLKNKDVHRKICDRLIESSDNTERALGLKLDELRQLRNDADYDWNLDQHYFNEHLDDVKINTEIAHRYLNALKTSPPFRV